MAERNIVASFKDVQAAERALDKLKDLGAAEVEICEPAELREDLAEGDTAGVDEDRLGPTGLTLDADVRQDVSRLRPATDVVSTAGEEEFEAATGEDVYLRAVVDESLHKRALQVLRETGGRV